MEGCVELGKGLYVEQRSRKPDVLDTSSLKNLVADRD